MVVWQIGTILGTSMNHFDYVSGEWLASSRLPRKGGSLGYSRHSPFIGQFAASTTASANLNFMGEIVTRIMI